MGEAYAILKDPRLRNLYDSGASLDELDQGGDGLFPSDMFGEDQMSFFSFLFEEMATGGGKRKGHPKKYRHGK